MMRAAISGVITAMWLLAGPLQAADAERVYVKYRGLVSLAGFQCQATVSSFVHRVCYAAEDRYVVVLLGSVYYHYCRVPERTVSAWLSAASKGKFYNAHVKGAFDCRDGGLPDS